MSRIRRRLRRVLNGVGACAGHYLFDVGGGREQTVWVVGDGRSGTTWVANLLNGDGRSRLLFEPCHPLEVADAERFGPAKYARPTDPEPELRAFYDRVFTGRFQHQWVDRFNTGWVYRRRVVKDIFANLFIKWAAVQYPEIPKVLVVRHPFAVAASKASSRDWRWFDDPAALLENSALADDFLAPFADVLRSADTFYDKQVAIWCVLHLIPFRQIETRDVHIVFYEHLLVQPEQELNRLRAFLGDGGAGLPVGDNLHARVMDPSPTSRGTGERREARDRLEGWKSKWSPEAIESALRILCAFGLDGVYGRGVLPDADAIRRDCPPAVAGSSLSAPPGVYHDRAD